MVHVAILGAAGGIGQPLALLLSQTLPVRSVLSLYDLGPTAAGVAADISHIDRDIQINHAVGALPPVPEDPALVKLASSGVDVFVVVAGVPRKPGMTRDDLFRVNAGIALDLVLTCAKSAPNAIFCIVTNPVNSVVPIAATALKKLGIYNKDKLFGVSGLDVLRANRFINVARAPYRMAPSMDVPVVGGHSQNTIVPIFSRIEGPKLSQADQVTLTNNVREAGTVVVKAKAGKGSATLSIAVATARFVCSVVSGLRGEANELVYAYVDTDKTQGADFLALPVLLGKQGILTRFGPGPMNEYESGLYDEAIKVVRKNIEVGVQFAKSKL